MLLESRFIVVVFCKQQTHVPGYYAENRKETTTVLESGYFPSQFVRMEARGEKEMKIQAYWNMRGKGHFWLLDVTQKYI